MSTILQHPIVAQFVTQLAYDVSVITGHVRSMVSTDKHLIECLQSLSSLSRSMYHIAGPPRRVLTYKSNPLVRMPVVGPAAPAAHAEHAAHVEHADVVVDTTDSDDENYNSDDADADAADADDAADDNADDDADDNADDNADDDHIFRYRGLRYRGLSFRFLQEFTTGSDLSDREAWRKAITKWNACLQLLPTAAEFEAAVKDAFLKHTDTTTHTSFTARGYDTVRAACCVVFCNIE